MIDFKVQIGKDTFGTFVETENYNDLDELEDLLIEQFSLIPKGIIDGSGNTGGLYRLYFNDSVSFEQLDQIIGGLHLPTGKTSS
jgi:hypothetical protein|tara:strand:- start:1535 stop:1786 length:252 start_codon:yes stop_codon:yes gene_type:complete